MAIPDYQTVMLPLLTLLSDKQERSLRDCVQILAEQFKLTPEEQSELLPGGSQATFHNRVGWARTYLKKAGLLEAPKRSYIKISQRGLEALSKKPKRIDVKFLDQYAEFLEFKGKRSDDTPERTLVSATSEKPPDEVMREAYASVRQVTKSELLDQIKKCSPAFFENLVVSLLVAMGYGGTLADAGKAIGKSGDGGIDGTIKEDKLGLDVIYLQAKRWENTVGRPQIQNFVGALHGKGSKGVFITTSNYSKEAIEYANTLSNLKIILIDGDKLADLMIEHNIGVSPKQVYEIKKVDYDYFSEEE